MSKNKFVSHFLPFQINTTILIFVNFFTKWLPVAILDVRKSLLVAFLAISDQYNFLFNFCYKMAAIGHFGCPKFTLDHIYGHFRSIQIFIFLFFTKWLPVVILDVRKFLSISFLAISDRYATLILFYFLTKWLPSAILDVRNSLWITFLAILNQ